MNRKSFFAGLLLMAMAATLPVMAADSPQPANAATTNAPRRQVIAYYFHGTVRCETCQRIERQAKTVIEQRFETELKSKQLEFKPLNYDLPENAHFLSDYKLPCPALVVVRQKDGSDEKVTLLGDTWELVGDEAKFNRYIETEVSKILRHESNSKTNAVPVITPKRR
jgi:hypothetical protein